MIRASIVLAAVLALSMQGHAATDPLDLKPKTIEPISAHPDRELRAFVAARCKAFLEAVQIYRSILRHNPVTGHNYDAGPEFAWIDSRSFYDNITSASEESDDYDNADFTQEYITAFGPIVFPSKVSQLWLYKQDTAKCIEVFGTAEEN